MTAWEEYDVKTTLDLITLFQKKKGGDKSMRKNAFFALVNRFKKDLLEKCEINCRRFKHPSSVAEIIADNTFQAYAKKGNFNTEKGQGITIDDSFRIYLYGIAKNELISFYRTEKKKENGQYYDGTEHIITELPATDLSNLSIEAKIKYEIVQALSPSHRTVYLTYLAYEKLGCNLPRKLQAELRKYLGNVTQNTIRSYKKEANDKIKQALRIMDLTINAKS